MPGSVCDVPAVNSLPRADQAPRLDLWAMKELVLEASDASAALSQPDTKEPPASAGGS